MTPRFLPSHSDQIHQQSDPVAGVAALPVDPALLRLSERACLPDAVCGLGIQRVVGVHGGLSRDGVDRERRVRRHPELMRVLHHLKEPVVGLDPVDPGAVWVCAGEQVVSVADQDERVFAGTGWRVRGHR